MMNHFFQEWQISGLIKIS